MNDVTSNLLRGAIDIHIHTAPDVFPRSVNDYEAAVQAKAAGMSGIVIKNHFTMTADRATFASELAGFPVYGSLVLNHYVGGFNLHAVDTAIRFGAKEIWMPTLTARKHLQALEHAGHVDRALRKGTPGLTVLDDNGEVLPEVVAILDAMARADVALGTAHLSPRESLILARTARGMGITKIIATHPEASFVGMKLEEMKELATLGAKLEFDYVHLTHAVPTPGTAATTARAIREIGAEHCVMATDGGQGNNPPPVEMLGSFIASMLELGISEGEIRTMVYTNPRVVLGVD